MRDLLPTLADPETTRWRALEDAIRRCMAQNAYQEIRAPLLEETALFSRSVGEETDIVHKEMYSFAKGDEQLTLRPEGTAGVVRAYIQGLTREPKPVKLFYIGPMFRHERPQAGRLRQFHQAGVEVFGDAGPFMDVAVIRLALSLFETLGLGDLTLHVNNIGDAASRTAFFHGFRERLAPHLSKTCPTCQRRYTSNPFRMLDCKTETCQALYADPSIETYLAGQWQSDASREHFNAVLNGLDSLGAHYEVNHRLVRGLDYYNATVFEIVSSQLGAQGTVCGGGRYDALVQELGGPATPGVGWALGMERLLSLCAQHALPTDPALDYYLVTDRPLEAMRIAETLRARGFAADTDLSGKGFGKQLAAADKRGARFAVILGEAEAAAHTLTLKILASGEQRTLSQDDFWASFAAEG
ncbi:MAG: histidine--tRNA ligase [Vampirovibrionales bacterium]|nr:histidine--tRNA ligase [Vampirovibrionales bacterium]